MTNNEQRQDAPISNLYEASPLLVTKHQLLLGEDAFVKEHQTNLQQNDLRELSIAHKRSMALNLAKYEAQSETRNLAMARTYQPGAYTMAEIADYFGVHYMTVSRAVRAMECNA